MDWQKWVTVPLDWQNWVTVPWRWRARLDAREVVVSEANDCSGELALPVDE